MLVASGVAYRLIVSSILETFLRIFYMVFLVVMIIIVAVAFVLIIVLVGFTFCLRFSFVAVSLRSI